MGKIMVSPSMNEYMEFAIQTAHEAGRLTLGYFRPTCNRR